MLLAAILTGVLLRLLCVPGGFPEVFHLDEDDVVESALYTLTGDPNPRLYKYPNLVPGLLSAVFRLLLQPGGEPESVGRAFAEFQENPVPVMLAARAVTLALSLLALPGVYGLAARLWGRTEALLASLFLCFSPLHLELSRLARVDGPGAAFTALAALAALSHVRGPSLLTLGLTSLAVGAAAATKYYGGLVLVPIIALLATRSLPWGVRLRSVLGLVVVSSASFVCLSPHVLLEWGEFLGFLRRAGHLYETAYWDPDRPAALAYAPLVLRYSIGPLGWAGVIGFVWSLSRGPGRRRLEEALLVLGYPILLAAPLVESKTFFPRFALPAVPFLCLAAGRGVLFLYSWLATKTHRLAAGGLVTLGLVALAADAFGTAHWIVRNRDPRILSRVWIEENVDPSVPILIENRRNGPYLRCAEEPLPHRPQVLRSLLAAYSPSHVAVLDTALAAARERAVTEGRIVHYETGKLREAVRRESWREAIVVISAQKAPVSKVADRASALARLRVTHKPIAGFRGGWDDSLGPSITIWAPNAWTSTAVR